MRVHARVAVHPYKLVHLARPGTVLLRDSPSRIRRLHERFGVSIQGSCLGAAMQQTPT